MPSCEQNISSLLSNNHSQYANAKMEILELEREKWNKIQI